ENPHHTATPAAVVGGGPGIAMPGAISRAHAGVLLLDEAPEFPARVLEALREPLEAGDITIHRARGVTRYPARFQLVLAANPRPPSPPPPPPRGSEEDPASPCRAPSPAPMPACCCSTRRPSSPRASWRHCANPWRPGTSPSTGHGA